MDPKPNFQPASDILELGDEYYDIVRPAAFPRHELRFRNDRWAERIGLGQLDRERWIAHFGRFEPLPGNLEACLTLRYHGHQFRAYNPEIGDGRGFLFAQLREPGTGRLLDLGTKGSGRTPWSRSGDGKLTLKGAVREVLATEMLEALGVDTSKTFSVIETGESLYRQDEPSPTRSAVLVRLSHGHLRIGTFQRYAYLRRPELLEKLLRYCAGRYYPALDAAADASELAPRFLESVSERCADVAAAWTLAGFVHGVLNTDNTNITGESFDYGPYRFLDLYDPEFTAAYFDDFGLYAFGRQPEAILWNLHQLAATLSTLYPSPEEAYNERMAPALTTFETAFAERARAHLLRRLNLRSRGAQDDERLLIAVFTFLAKQKVGFESFFFDWSGGEAAAARALGSHRAERYTGPELESLRDVLHGYDVADRARLDHPYFRRADPSTLIIGEIENLWLAIDAADDWGPFEAKVRDIHAMHGAWA